MRWRAAIVGLAALAFAGLAASPAMASARYATPGAIQAGLAKVWTADTAASATLPDGKVLYVGGDATMDQGKPYGTSTMWWFPHQVGALESSPGSGVFSPVRGVSVPGDGGCTCQLVPNFANGDAFWPGGLLVTGTTVWLYGQEIHGSGLAARSVVNYVARFSAATMAFEGLTQLSGVMGMSDAVAWPGGHWLIASRYVPSPDCSYAVNCFEGHPLWIPSGAEASPSRWTVYPATIPVTINGGANMEPFRYGGRWLMITEKGDQYGGYRVIEEATAVCMAGCKWTLTGKTWPATGQDDYSARVHPGEAAAGELISNSASTPYGDYFQEAAQP